MRNRGNPRFSVKYDINIYPVFPPLLFSLFIEIWVTTCKATDKLSRIIINLICLHMTVHNMFKPTAYKCIIKQWLAYEMTHLIKVMITLLNWGLFYNFEVNYALINLWLI